MRTVVLVLVIVASPALAWPQTATPPAPFKWWLSPEYQAQLHLTPEQATAIDRVFESNLPQRRALREQMDTLDAEVTAMLNDPTADDAAAEALIARAEAARARRNVARTMLLFHIRQELTPEQREWFDHRAPLSGPRTGR